MRSGLRDWLPIEVLERPAVRRRVEEVVETWRAAWLPNLPLQIARWETSTSGALVPPEEGRRTCGEVVEASVGQRASSRLLEACMDAELNDLPTDADRRVIDHVLKTMIEDLVATLEGALGAAHGDRAVGRSATAGVRCGVGRPDGGVLIWLLLPQAALLALAQASLPEPRTPATLLGSRRQALAEQTLAIDVVLGEARLPLQDVASLRVGDVLVLDRKLEERAELRRAGAQQPWATGAVADLGGSMTITLHASVTPE